jgi:phage-related protein (TIGR01555 family)
MSKNRRTAQNNRLPNGQFPKGVTGNENGRPRLDGKPANKHYSSDDVKAAVNTALSEARMDGWYNLITSIGTTTDKTTHSEMSVVPVSDMEARSIYRGDSFGARIADARPREMFRAGWKLKISDADIEKKRSLETAEGEPKKLTRADARKLKRRLDATASKTKDLAEKVMNRARDLEVNAKFKQALTLANVDGGAAILIGANDRAKDWKLPLNANAIRLPDQLSWLTVIEARHLTPVAYYNNPRAPKFGQVAIWQINPQVEGGIGVDREYVPQAINVHESRLLIFQGTKLVDTQIEGTRPGFGDSVYTRLKGTLSRYSMGWNAAAILLNEFSIACMKIKGLAEMASQDAKKKLMTRMAAVALGRSVANLTLLDKDEEITRDTASIAGLADLLHALMQELAGQADVPATILMGMSPAGLNATGASDVRGWYDRIASEFVEKVDPKLRYLLAILLRSINSGKEPEKWSIDLNPLWQESPKEKADTALSWASVDEKNITNGLYSVEEARRSRYGGDEFGEDIVIDSDDDLEVAGVPDPDMEEAKRMAAEGALDPKAPSKPEAKPGEVQASPQSPSSGTAPTPAAGEIAKQAMNGAQVTSLVEVVKAAVAGEIPREAASAIIELAFQLSNSDAARVLGPVNFEPKKEEPAIPFGGAPFPPKPPGAQVPPKAEPPAKEEKPEPPKPPRADSKRSK